MIAYKELNDILQTFSEHSSFLIVLHDKPDGDAVGSGTALALFLKKLGKAAAVLTPCAIPHRLCFIKSPEVTYIEGAEALQSSDFSYDLVVCADVASDELIESVRPLLDKPVRLALDHHRVNTLTAEEKHVDEQSAATGEVLFALFSMYAMVMNRADIFDKAVCEALYASIASDTGCFKYGNTTEQSHDIAAKLFSVGIDAEEINRRLFDVKTPSQLAVERLALSNLQLLYEGRLAVVAVDLEELTAIGATEEDTETVSQLARTVEGVQIGVLMREKHFSDGTVGYKFSVRSNVNTDVSELCAHFGGGGHRKAAGCTVRADKQKAFDRFVAAAKDYLENG